jgi:predicted RNA-binding Zn-ribbon protein involved in translation (DUF1610 family)
VNCRTCQYALWNLRARECPECGAPFAPRDFEFVPNTVHFLCPHCGQAYYGTSAKGHLEPESFLCVTCGSATGMDDMVLLPAEGVAERQTAAAMNPWLDRGAVRGIKAWLATIGQALVTPMRLMRGTPIESSLGRAFWFSVITQTAAIVVAGLPMAIIFAIPAFAGAGAGGRGPLPAAFMIATVAGMIGFGLGALLLGAALWALAAHLLLVMTGRKREPLRRTFQAIWYSSGANALLATPCMGQYFGLPWWIVSACLMVKEGHGIHGGRAAFAVVTPPVLAFLAFVGFYVVMIAIAIGASGGFAGGPGGAAWAFSTQQSQVQTVVQSLITNAMLNQGRWPGHASELVAGRSVDAWSFVDADTPTTPSDVPLTPGATLDDLQMTPDMRSRRALASAAAAALPPGVVAHRVGDFVFTYHGVAPTSGDRRVWLAVMCADPALAGGAPPGDVVAGSLDGAVQVIPAADVPAVLAGQNLLRAVAGLPPLPDPRTVTHRAPAVAPAEAPPAGGEP